MSDNRHQLIKPMDIRNFVLGGKATFTIVSNVTGKHLTFRVKQAKYAKSTGFEKAPPKGPLFVSAMTGPDNEFSYSYLGQIWLNSGRPGCGRDGQRYPFYQIGKKTQVAADDPTQKAFAWFMDFVRELRPLPAGAEFWHEGKCCRCGRKLTVPESIEKGIGPICDGGRR